VISQILKAVLGSERLNKMGRESYRAGGHIARWKRNCDDFVEGWQTEEKQFQKSGESESHSQATMKASAPSEIEEEIHVPRND